MKFGIVGAGAVGSAWISNQPTNAVRFLTQLAHDCEIPCGSCCLARQQKPSRHGLEELSELIAIRFRPFEKPTTITNGQRQDFLFARAPKTSRRTICRRRRCLWRANNAAMEAIMNEDVFNTSIRKFLKTLGVTAQREIEKAVRQAVADGKLNGNEKLSANATVTLAGIGLAHEVKGEIELE